MFFFLPGKMSVSHGAAYILNPAIIFAKIVALWCWGTKRLLILRSSNVLLVRSHPSPNRDKGKTRVGNSLNHLRRRNERVATTNRQQASSLPCPTPKSKGGRTDTSYGIKTRHQAHQTIYTTWYFITLLFVQTVVPESAKEAASTRASIRVSLAFDQRGRDVM